MASSSPLPSHLRARQLWESSAFRQAAARANWRWMAFFLALLSATLSIALWIEARGDNIRLYLVEVDRHGHAVAFGPIASQPPTPGDEIKRYVLSLFIHDWRTVTTPEAIGQNLKRAAALVAGRAAHTLATDVEARNPYEVVKSAQVLTAIESLLLIDPAEDIWRARWTETTITQGRSSERFWEATLKLTVDPPSRPQLFDRDRPLILLNPLGIYVSSLDLMPLPPKET